MIDDPDVARGVADHSRTPWRSNGAFRLDDRVYAVRNLGRTTERGIVMPVRMQISGVSVCT